MGVYNHEEIYITTETKAPYVYDPNDGLFYVYNIVGEPWIGKLPDNYQEVMIDMDGDGKAEYYKYSSDGVVLKELGIHKTKMVIHQQTTLQMLVVAKLRHG